MPGPGVVVPGVVVIGAGQAAVQLAASLRQGGYAEPITLIGDEPGLPYQRPPLSKAYMTGEMNQSALLLRPENFYEQQRIDLLENTKATSIDRATKRVHLANGALIEYTHLVLATGARNRQLPNAEGAAYLRTKAEADHLRGRLDTAGEIIVIGAGFIGLEFAAVAAARGAQVTIVEMAPVVMGRAVSKPMADHVAALHRQWGSHLLTNTGVNRITATTVETTTGKTLTADIVVAGIGVLPNTDLAEQAGLPIANGICVDATLRTQDPAISAIGDCASFPSAFGPIRLESVQNAADQARAVADRLLGRPTPYGKVPWFWSDQGPLKLQIAGLITGHDRCILRGTQDSGSFSVFCYRGETLLGIESINRPAEHMISRRLLVAPKLTHAQAADDSFDLRTALT